MEARDNRGNFDIFSQSRSPRGRRGKTHNGCCVKSHLLHCPSAADTWAPSILAATTMPARPLGPFAAPGAGWAGAGVWVGFGSGPGQGQGRRRRI